MKRAFAVLCSVLMFHLTMVGADFACATHGAPATRDVHAAPAGGHEHGHPTQSHSEQKDRCDIPVTQDCCTALASCTPSVAAESAVMSLDTPSPRSERPSSTLALALSRDTAPETPPPRV